jgi:hypothetical protein
MEHSAYILVARVQTLQQEALDALIDGYPATATRLMRQAMASASLLRECIDTAVKP